MTLRDLTLGDGYQAGETCFRGQQVVVIQIQSAGGDVVADMEDLALRIEQERKIHCLKECITATRQVVKIGSRGLRPSSRQYPVRSPAPAPSGEHLPNLNRPECSWNP